MTSKVTYSGSLRTEAIHLKSGTEIITDAPTDNQGKGEAFSPTDLVATALASCMVTIMGIKARDKGINIEGTKTSINKIMASNPRRIDKVEITIDMPDETYSDKDKKLLIAAAENCPVMKSIHPDIAVELVWNW